MVKHQTNHINYSCTKKNGFKFILIFKIDECFQNTAYVPKNTNSLFNWHVIFVIFNLSDNTFAFIRWNFSVENIVYDLHEHMINSRGLGIHNFSVELLVFFVCVCLGPARAKSTFQQGLGHWLVLDHWLH